MTIWEFVLNGLREIALFCAAAAGVFLAAILGAIIISALVDQLGGVLRSLT